MEIYVTDSTQCPALPLSSNGPVHQDTDATMLDEFVLDLASLQSECDYKYLMEERNIHDIPETDTAEKSDDKPSLTTSSGYESDSEEEGLAPVNKRKKIRKYRSKQGQPSDETISQNYSTNTRKRKICPDDSSYISGKRLKLAKLGDSSAADACSSSDSDYSSSSSDSSSDSSSCTCSSSDTSSSSDSSSSDSDESSEENSSTSYRNFNSSSRLIQCPDPCVCNAGQSDLPPSIERRANVPIPLYQRLLRCRLLNTACTGLYTCCRRRCYRHWI